jgi:predicted PurR-regulated permease PerM
MIIVATFTSLGLWLIGLPGFLVLGLLTGLAEVVSLIARSPPPSRRSS